MDLSLRDALGGVGGGVPGGAPGEGLLKRDFVASLEKESYDDKVGETVTKSDYRPLVDGKDTKSGAGMMSSVMSSGGCKDIPGQPAFSSDYMSGPMNMMGGMVDQWSQNKTKDSSMPDSMLGFSQSGMGGTNVGMGSGLPPFQSSMSSSLGQSGIVSAMDAQKSSGLFGSEPKTTTNTSGSALFKPSDPFSSSSPGIHSMDNSTAPILSPSGSLDDSSPTSSTSETLSPERVGPGGEVGKQQRRRKKKRKGRDEVYDFLDRQEVENNNGQSNKHGMISPSSSQEKGGGEEEEEEEDEEEEESWEWEIRGRGGGGRVRGRKTKSRMRLPEEWGAPQQPASPTPAAVAPNLGTAADSGPSGSKALEPNPDPRPDPVLPSAPSQIPTSFTNPSHASNNAELPPRSYEPMCVHDFPVSAKDVKMASGAKDSPFPSTGKVEANNSLAATAVTKASLPGDGSGSLALMTGDNLSPVSQTFSFLDSVLQTPPASTPGSQTTTPITNTPSLATAPPAKTSPPEITSPASQTSSIFHPSLPPSKSTPDLPPASALSMNPSLLTGADTHLSATAAGSTLNPDAKPFVPSATPTSSTTAHTTSAATSVISTAASDTTETPALPSTATPTAVSATPPSSSATPCASEATRPSPSDTPTPKVATPPSLTATPPPSITPAVPPSLPAHSEHQDSSPPPLPLLEGW